MQDLKVWGYDDIFNPVTDLNANFETVKNAIETLEGGAETDEQDINDLKTKVGSDTLVTTAQDLSGAVNELDDDLNHASTGVIARLTSAENDINTLQTQAGSATLVTTAQTLSGAVNELDDDLNHASTGVIARLTSAENDITDLKTQAIQPKMVSVTTNEGESYGQAVTRAFTQFRNAPTGKTRRLFGAYIAGFGRFNVLGATTSNNTFSEMHSLYVSSTRVIARYIRVTVNPNETTNMWQGNIEATQSLTIVDEASTVPTTGTDIVLYYEEH